MATTASTLLAEIYVAIGRSDTATAQVLGLRGLSFGQAVATALFSPPELKTSTSLTVTASVAYTSLSGITRLLEVDHLYNTTSSGPVFLMTMDHFLKNIDTTLTGNVKFAARYGNVLYIHPTPTVDNTLTAYYKTYPATLTSTSDVLAISGYDDFILNCAIQFCWAGLEEGESASVMESLIQKVTAGHQLTTAQRAIIEKEAFGGLNIQGAKA